MDLVQAQRFKPKLPSSISYLRMVSSWQLTDHWGTKRCLGGGRLVDMQPSHYRWTSACMNERVYRICTVSHYKERGADIEVAGSGQGGGGRNWLKFIFCLILYVNNVHKHTHERPSMRTMSRQLLKGGTWLVHATFAVQRTLGTYQSSATWSMYVCLHGAAACYIEHVTGSRWLALVDISCAKLAINKNRQWSLMEHE